MSDLKHEDRKPRVRSPMTIEILFNRAKDRNDDTYYIGQDIGMVFDAPIGDMVLMFFPGKDNLPPKLVMKPRRDMSQEEMDTHD